MNIIYRKHEDYPDLIFIRKLEGEIDLNDIIKSWEYLIESNMISEETRGIINDISSCIWNMTMDSFDVLLNFLKNNSRLSKLKLAVICTDPSKIVFPLLGEKKEIGLSIKTFSTMDGAVEWILQ